MSAINGMAERQKVQECENFLRKRSVDVHGTLVAVSEKVRRIRVRGFFPKASVVRTDVRTAQVSGKDSKILFHSA